MRNRKDLAIQELIEINEFFDNELPINPVLFIKNDINITNVIFLSFVEDEETEEYVGYFYNKENHKFYQYIFDTLNNTLKLNETVKPTIKECRTILMLDDYIN